MGSNSIMLDLTNFIKDSATKNTEVKKHVEKLKCRKEGDIKWLLDENGNLTGEGVLPNGQHISDCVYRPPQNDYNDYEET